MRANSLCVFCPPIHIFCLLIFHIFISYNPCVFIESHFFVTIANGNKCNSYVLMTDRESSFFSKLVLKTTWFEDQMLSRLLFFCCFIYKIPYNTQKKVFLLIRNSFETVQIFMQLYLPNICDILYSVRFNIMFREALTAMKV